MIPGKSIPKFYENIWATAFVEGETECFELRTGDGIFPLPGQVLYHREGISGYAIADFVAVTENELNAVHGIIVSVLDEMSEHNKVQVLQSLIQYSVQWMNRSGLFAPLGATIGRIVKSADEGASISLDEIDKQIEQYKLWLPKLNYIAEKILPINSQTDMLERYMNFDSKKDGELLAPLCFDGISVQTMIKDAEGFFPYDNHLEFSLTKENLMTPVLTEVIETNEVEDYIAFVLYRYLKHNLRFRTCKFCKRPFGILGNPIKEYCDRVIDGSKKTCSQMGALRIYEKKTFANPAVREYKRSYKAHNARIRYGLLSKEDFSEWSKQARQMRDLCLTGKITLEELVLWLDSDSIR